MPAIARIVLFMAAALVMLGGLYDVFVPRLPANLTALCGGDERTCKLARELLRALGGALAAIGLGMMLQVATSGEPVNSHTLVLILLLVVPAEGVNAFCMFRVGSPGYIPLAFVLLTCIGAVLAWLRY